MPHIQDTERPDAALLGGGVDITGRHVEFFGEVWTIIGKNYLGDWDIARVTTTRSGERRRICSSIAPEILPEEHGHFARLVSHS